MTDTPPFNASNIPTLDSSLSEWIYYMQQIHVSAIDMGLSRVLPVANALGLVQSAKDDAYVFTVAGTNGKGSTTAVISAICQQAGYKTALYQSPHLIDFNERVRINGQPVGDDVLITAFYEVEQARLSCELTLSFFEMTTLAAMLIFAQANCDVWVLEVGLGGRLDVVNIIDPDLAVITNIGIDHVDWLGDTREKIGYEKAGILRQGVPLIYGESDMPASVSDKASDLQCPIYQFDHDFSFRDDDANDTESSPHSRWQFSSAHVTLDLPTPQLSLINTTNAVAAVLASRLAIQHAHIEQALTQVKLAGRFDKRRIDRKQWLFDVAHNDRGVEFLLRQLIPLWHQYHQSNVEAKLHLVFSMLGDKEIDKVVQLIVSSGLPIQQWHIAEIDYPRAASVERLQTTVQDALNRTNNLQSTQHIRQDTIADQITIYPSLAQATQGVIDATQQDDFILVCGSFHTIGAVLKALAEEQLDYR